MTVNLTKATFFLRQSLEFQESLNSSRPFLLRTDPALWKRRKYATSKPHTLWATRTLTLNSGPRQ